MSVSGSPDLTLVNYDTPGSVRGGREVIHKETTILLMAAMKYFQLFVDNQKMHLLFLFVVL